MCTSTHICTQTHAYTQIYDSKSQHPHVHPHPHSHTYLSTHVHTHPHHTHTLTYLHTQVYGLLKPGIKFRHFFDSQVGEIFPRLPRTTHLSFDEKVEVSSQSTNFWEELKILKTDLCQKVWIKNLEFLKPFGLLRKFASERIFFCKAS